MPTTTTLDPPGTAATWRRAGVAAHQAGHNDEAATAFRHAIAASHTPPDQAADHANLGAVLRALGRTEEAETAYRQAIALDPTCAAAHHNLANLLRTGANPAAAEASYREAVTLLPAYAQAWNGLGMLQQQQGALADAVESYSHAVHHLPHWAEARVNLGVALLGLDRGEEAAQAFRAVIAEHPTHATAHGNLGAVYVRAGLPIRAETALRQAIAFAPAETRWTANLAVALQMQGRHAETEACCRAVLAARPAYASAHGNLLFALNYREDLTPEAIFAEYQAWDAAHARPLAPARPRFAHDRTPGRRLRVGYVSPDFRHHAVALFAEPLLAAHNPAEIELFCYAEVAVPDATTARFRALAAHWRPTLGLSDDALADMIRADRIDILVDLAGHTAANRLTVFARRPAPVQVASLLGHGYTSGLSAMDGLIADAAMVPPGAEPLFSETIVRIDRIPLAYAPPAAMPPVAPPPCARNGHITFGHFGRPERFNPAVIAAWSRILHGVPTARLRLNTRALQEPAFRARIAEQFAAHAIPPDRLDLVFTQPQPQTWADYAEIDIALDPFPHNAGTTTIEALWQGVPVITLAGRPSVGRIGASILGAVGLPDWIAPDTETYIARAIAAAHQPAGLATLRARLRAMVRASPLCDAPGLARLTERAYRALWDRWREGDADRLHQAYTAGDATRARALANRMLSRDSHPERALHVRALLNLREGRAGEAALDIEEAITLTPADPELRANQAAILRTLGRLPEAEAAARAALALSPANPAAHNNLGNILRDAGRATESAAAYREALRLAPDFADAWANLAWLLALAGQAQAAETAARRALAIDPAHANAANNLGLALMRQGRLAEAETTLRHAIALRPEFPLPHSNLLFCLNYRTDLPDQAIAAEYREWNRRHAQPLAPTPPIFANDRSPTRRLRIGYVSPDFRHHAAAFFAEPLLAAHDRTQIHLTCYAEVPVPDATTARFQALSDNFVPTVGLTDEALAERIRADHIDVLIDLAGHTGGNRLLVFARCPAPIQIATMLGLGTTSGLSAMTAFIADAALIPPGAEPLFAEPVLRLPRVPLAYTPPAGMPEPGPFPALSRGHLTFGYFGRTVRLNETVIATWARILAALPTARLCLNSAPFAEPAARTAMHARFAAHAIRPDRLDLVFTTPQSATWAAYADIDIALDPFPHNAGTTTVEALWQGVPVLTLASRPGVGRLGAMLLTPVGLTDWIAATPDAYVERAIAAAADLPALAALRAELRPRVAASGLGDAPGLARAFEAAYRQLWVEWCEAQTSVSF